MAEVEKPSSTPDGTYTFRPWEDCPQSFSEEEYAADIQFQKQHLNDPIRPPPVEYTEWRWRKRAPTFEDLGYMRDGLRHLADDLPPDLPPDVREYHLDMLDRLEKLISWVIERPLSRREIRNVRHQFVRAAIVEQGMKREAAYDEAATLLAGTDFECGRDMMKKAYDAMEREKRELEKALPF